MIEDGGQRGAGGASDVGELDRLADGAVTSALAACCGARRWVERMVDSRPFGDVETLLRRADEIWWSLAPDEWREAFAHHPRIGERSAKVAQEARARSWSASEQRGLDDASFDVRSALAEANREYERRFGHIYLVSAAGKSADELLALLRTRLLNDPATELEIAAREQAKITRLRLLKLIEGSGKRADARGSAAGGGGV
jgi:2-oxo-4-hydroxy-4-carboxy-5-ureidoimidazoline decarboxylase